MLYELLGGDRPFHGHTYEELMVAHLTRFPMSMTQVNPLVPRPVGRLAELALAKRAADRPSADQIRRALLSALGETPADEVYEEDAKPEAEAARPMGRHAPAQVRPLTSPAPEPEPEKGARWNPFRRRK
jgi:serine/threonine-protein kinase